MNLVIRIKGSPTSGWYSPPKGTHSGDKHREVGSGKAVEKPSVIDPRFKPVLVDTVSDLVAPRGVAGYFIRADGKLVDVDALGVALFGDEMLDDPDYVLEHVWVIENHPELLGLTRGQLQALPAGGVGMSRYDKLLNDNNIVRVFYTPKVVAVDGVSLDRRGIDTLQRHMLTGKKLPISKVATYVWEPAGTAESVSFTYANLMMAKYPRDLKDMEYMLLKIILRSSITV